MKSKKTKKIEVRLTAKELKDAQIAAKKYYEGNVSKFLRAAIRSELDYCREGASFEKHQTGKETYETT